ncbi:MAG: SRPBCC family protein [Chloroflexota bacterium]|nr:SRPBCC family protein [Chloroflexota bacterium]
MIRRFVAATVGGLAGAVVLDRWLGGLTLDDDGRPIRVPIRSRIEIDAPIGAVWARLADIASQPEWMTEMKTVRLTTPGPIGVGTRAEADVRILGITVLDPIEIVEFNPPHRFAIRHDGRFKGDGLVTLDTLDGGRRTRVDWAETLIPPILPNLGSMVQGPVLQRVFQADLGRLKTLVETDQGADAPPAKAGADPTRPTEPATAGPNGHGTRPAG